MDKKQVMAGSKRKQPPPPQDPAKPSHKRFRSKSTSKQRSRTKSYKLAGPEEKPLGHSKYRKKSVKGAGARKRLIERLGGKSADESVRRYLKLPTTKTLPKFEGPLDHLYEEAHSELTTGGRTLDPKAEEILKDAVKEARRYLKSIGSPAKEVERARVSLKVFGQSFVLTEERISAAVMQRKMKRWLPCPPFCKEGK